MVFTSSELNEYLNFLSSKQGFIEETVNYLSNKMNILEKATLHVNKVLSIYQIVMLAYEDEFLIGKSVNDKINFLKKCFETLFIYSKNLLTKFSFYFDKPVNEEVFQDLNFLSRFLNNHNYTSLIGYVFQPDTNDWRFMENTLSPERTTDLQCLTICSCVGYDYWPNLLKYLNLTVFTSHRLSIEKLMIENKCDYCEFDLNPNQYSCTVCKSEIDKMTFFDKWHQNLTRTSSIQDLHEGIKPKRQYSSLNFTIDSNVVDNRTCEHSNDKICDNCAFIINKDNLEPNGSLKNKDEIKTDHWTCECTYVNNSSCLNCQVCFKENINSFKVNRHRPLSEWNRNEIKELVISDQSYKNETIPEQIGVDEWVCAKCTVWNSNKSLFCPVCLNENKNSQSILPDYKSMEINKIDTNQYLEQSLGIDLVHSLYSNKIKSEIDKSNDFVLVDLSISRNIKQNTESDIKNSKETAYMRNKDKNEPGFFERICHKIFQCILFFYDSLKHSTSKSK